MGTASDPRAPPTPGVRVRIQAFARRFLGPAVNLRHLLTLQVAILLVAIAVYSVYWSYVSILKYYALNDYIFDLGISAQGLWDIYGLPWTPSRFALVFFVQGIRFLLFPLALAGSYEVLFVAQSIAIAAAALPLYGAARRVLGRPWLAMGIGLGYLLYFPLAGLNWYDFHYEAFFPFLFLSGYYFYVTGRYRMAVVFLALSGTVGYFYMVMPLLFALTVGIERFFGGSSIRGLLTDTRGRFALVITTLAVVMMGAEVAVGGSTLFSGTGGYLHAGAQGPVLNIDTKVMTLFVLLAPLLFVPLFSLRGLALFSPYVYLLFTLNYAPYEFPELISHQYVSILVPALFLGLIEGLLWFSHGVSAPDPVGAGSGRRSRIVRTMRNPRQVIPGAIFCAILLMALVYQPYGPFNRFSQADFDVSAVTSVNSTLLNELDHVLTLIPRNDPNVLLQDNLPQALPGTWGDLVKIPGLLGPNVTQADIANNSYPYTGGTKPQSVAIDYALADLSHPDPFNYALEGGFPSMYTLMSKFLASGHYGVQAEAGGILLVSRGYTGPVQYFVPLDRHYGGNGVTGSYPMQDIGRNQCLSNYYIKGSPESYHGTIVWFGPFISLPPGSYQVTYDLYTNDTSPRNNLTVDVSGNHGSNVSATVNLTGASWAHEGWWNLTIGFNLTNVLSNVEFRGWVGNWNGTLCLGGISLTQLSGGLPSPSLKDLGNGGATEMAARPTRGPCK